MRLTRTLWLGFLVLAPAVPVLPLAGCGGGVPETGTMVSPVDTQQAASQNKAMEEFYKSKKAASKPKR